MQPLRRQSHSLGQILEGNGLIVRAQLDEALEEQRRTGEPLGRVLVRHGWVTERDILHALEGLLVVTFGLGGELFAAETLYVREIIRAQACVPVPQVPGYVEGLISLRDRVVPVIDLRRRFDLPPDTVSEASRVMVCEMPGRLAGLLVDSVGAVVQYSMEQISPCPFEVNGIPPQFLYGMGRQGDQIATILNLEPLLASREAIHMRSGKGTPSDAREQP